MSPFVPVQFDWRAKAGDIVETGRGTLSPSMSAKRSEIDEFTAAIGNLIAAAYPQRGELHLDHQKVYHCPCRQPHKLLWFWRMEINLSSGTDRNTGPASFVCYGLGLECAQNKFGVRFLGNGDVRAGLE